MKNNYKLKIRLTILLSFFSILATFAQVNTYSFSSSAGTYTPITGGTVFGATTSDDQRFVDPATPLGGTVTTGVGLPIGFNFTYNGIVFDRIAINNNGWISFGQSALTPSVNNASSSGYTAISATSTATPTLLRNRMAGLARDLQGQTGSELRMETIGASPNMVCVIQWTNYRKFGATGDSYNFQIRLYETTNIAEVVYGVMTNNATAATPQVGLSGTTNADFNNRTTTTDWSATTAGAVNNATCTLSATVFPTPGQTFTWTPPAGCTGTPVAGTTNSTSTNVGIGEAFTLSLTGAVNASGLTYQWQSSTDNASWTDIAGATGMTYTTTQTAATYYQCIITCTNSGLFSNSTSVLVNLSSSIFMFTGSATVCSGSFYDTGGPSAAYGNSQDYTLTLYPSTVGASLQALFNSFAVETCCDNLKIYNGNSIAAPLIGTYTANPGTILSTATDGSLTFVFHSDGSVTQTGWDATISCISGCTGTPVAGNANSSANPVCSGVNFTLSLTGNVIASGLSYQWQSSADGVTYSDIAGATNPTYSVSQTAATYYQAVITCTNSSSTATSVPIQVTMSPFTNCYCTSSANNTADEEIYSVTVNGSTNAYNCTTIAPGPGSILSRYSNFTTLPALTTVTQGSTVPFSIEENECDGATFYAFGSSVWIDFNQNGLFTDAGEQVFVEGATAVGPRTITGNFNIPLGATLGNTRMRIIVAEGISGAGLTPCLTYGYGETEDYLINIMASTLCAGTPTPGVTQSTAPSVCTGTNFNLSMSTPPSGLSNITYQWQSSSDGITYTDIAGATNQTYSTTQTADTYYQVVVTCTNSSSSATSTPILVTMNPFYNCYCTTSTATSSADEDIFNVTIGTLNNSSTCATTGGAGSVLNRYSDYTTVAAVPNLAQSATYPLSVQVGTCGGNFGNSTRVFIDYNHNGLFTDAGETAYTSAASTTGPHVEGGNIIIPAGALTGNTRMRVVTVETGTPTSITPCGSYNWGETEDYLVNIIPLPPNPPTPVQDPAVPSCSTGTDLTVPGSPAAGDSWYWQTTALGTSTTNPVSGAYTVFFNGTYYVRTYNAANNVWSLGSDSVIVSNIPLAATPPAPTAAASPACLSTTISMPEPASGTAYFWQGTNSNGVSSAQNASTPLTINNSGTYYVAAFDSTTSCWSITNNVAVTIETYVPPMPTTTMDSVVICQGVNSAIVNASTGGSGTTITSSFGLNLISTGTGASTYNVTVPAIPAGATITSTQLEIIGATAMGGSYRSEIRVALSGATTLAPTQISTLTSAGLITPDPTITVPDLPLAGGAVTLSLTETFDDTGTDATFTEVRLVITYTLPPATITWWDASTAGTLQGSGSPFETVGSLYLPNTNTAGTYTFYAAATSGACSSTRLPVDVIINPLPTRVLNDTAICSGAYVTLDAQNAGDTYLWNTSESTQTISVFAGGLYYVDITTPAGCSVRDSINLLINSLPVVNLGSDVSFCAGDAILIDAGNTGFNFLWNDSTTSQTLNATTGGNYFVTVTNPTTTCSASDTIMVTVNAWPVINLGVDTLICIGDSLILNAGNPGADYFWSNSTSAQTLTVNSAGTYSVTVTDPITTCFNMDTISIGINSLPVVNIGADTAICSGDVLTINAGHPGSAYAWNTSSSAQTINVSTAGNYSVLVTDVNGCKGTDSINVSINSLPVVNLGNDITQCAGTVNLNAGNTGSSFVWNDLSTSQTLAASTTGLYFVAVTNTNGCTSSDSVNLTINPLPVVNLGSDVNQCGGSVLLDAGNPGFIHLWYNNTTNQTLTVYASNSINVTVTNPVTGCFKSDTINVFIGQYPVVNLGNDIVQCAGIVTLNAGSTGTAFIWNTGASTQTITASVSGTYYVGVTNNTGCTTFDSVDVTINPLPVIMFPVIEPLCLQGELTALVATPVGGTFTGGPEVTAGVFDPEIAGVGSHPVLYSYTDANSCTNTFIQMINVEDCTGIEENESIAEVNIYPNPTSGMFNISVTNANFTELNISIVNIQGKGVYNYTEKNIPVDYNKQIDLEGLAKGIYYIRLNTKDNFKVRKLIIQ
jgi:hypothetical protein